MCFQEARTLADRSEEFKTGLKESVAPVIEQLEDRLGHLKLKEEPIHVEPPATDAEVEDFFSVLHVIDDSLDMKKVTQKDLKKSARLTDFMARHCRLRQYTFQVSKYGQ